MKAKIVPEFKPGLISPPPSKSEAIRAIIMSAISNKKTVISLKKADICSDVSYALKACEILGCEVKQENDYIAITPAKTPNKNPVFDCGASAALLRFMIPIASAVCDKANFTGDESLKLRPLDDIINCLIEHNVSFSSYKLPLNISGNITSGIYEINADISSQYISGLLIALPLLGGNSEIRLKTNVISEGYINLTIDCLKMFGVYAKRTDYGYFIRGSQAYISTGKIDICSDWSAASNFIVLGAVCGGAKIKGLSRESIQPDKMILDIIKNAGADFSFDEENVLCIEKKDLYAIDMDMSSCPDIVLITAALAAFCCGTSRLKNISRLRLKESDRINATIEMLAAFNIKSYFSENTLYIEGGKAKNKGEVNTYNDHRIAMAASILSLMSGSGVILSDYSCVNKSYPAFYDDLKSFGGEVYEI